MYIGRKEMTRLDKDEEREERINMEIIVDAYGPEEQAIGWYNYLDDTLQLPLVHLVGALRAPRKAHVLIRIEKEAIPRGLFAQLRYGLLFPIRHCYIATL
jgi:hypothetical protein